MIQIFQSFLEHSYWIDILSILAILGLITLQIAHSAKKRVEANIRYNKELTAMRTAIYTEYEKNFFL